MAKYGPGFERMRRRLGKQKLEALRRDTLKLQTDALKDASEALTEPRDRETYRDYPKPRGNKCS